MHGYSGQILRVDLDTATLSIDQPSEAFYRQNLGGRGLIAHILLTEVPRGADPLGPANRLVFALGPLSGHALAGSGRNSIGAKSPLTDGFGESEAGGFWGAELRKAGFDAIVVRGVSPRPVYLWIDDEGVELRDAAELWGREVADAQRRIRELTNERLARTAIIGPGGENGVRYACILNDVSHAAGRTGLGAVMGAKRLKAVAVRSRRAPVPADPAAVKRLAQWMAANYKRQTGMWKVGTGGQMDAYHVTGNLPIRNFQGGMFPQQVAAITAQATMARYGTRMANCHACPVRCKKVVALDGDPDHDPAYGGPEYETLAALGANCGVDDLPAIIRGHERCGRYGIDTISTGVSISFAMECFERGILTREDTGGIELTFGNAAAMLAMIEQIARRRGLGRILGLGTRRAAEIIGKGSAAYAMHVKGSEVPMHEPRFKHGMGLSYAVNPAGADHASGIHDDRLTVDLSHWMDLDDPAAVPPSEMGTRKARIVFYDGAFRHLPNTLGYCFFVPWSRDQLCEALTAVTGWTLSQAELIRAVARGMTLARIFNLREGFTAADDVLPQRFFTPAAEGPLKDTPIDPQRLAEGKREYYRLLGWDAEGVPTPAGLAELDLAWAAEYL